MASGRHDVNPTRLPSNHSHEQHDAGCDVPKTKNLIQSP